jgi:hypothetical protein
MDSDQGEDFMDPITLIVTALAAGAAAGAKPTAEQAIKDTYAGLKNLIQHRFSQVDVKPLEQKPESIPKRDSIAEDLIGAGADKDPEVLQLAQELIKLIESKAPEEARNIGVDLHGAHTDGSINIENVVSSGPGIVGSNWDAQQDITIKDVYAGQPYSTPQPVQQKGDLPNS